MFSEEKKAILQKILNQAEGLNIFGHGSQSGELLSIAKSGVIDNAVRTQEYATSLYCKALLPRLIRKSMDIDAQNNALNYDYTVLRAANLRSIAATDLLLAVGIWHSSDLNPGNLADNPIELFRPFVDIVVREMFQKNRAANYL